MLVLWFRKNHSAKDWKAMKYFTLATVALLYVSFLFSIKKPHSHTFYLTLPIAMLYSFYCWNEFLKKKSWQKFALVFIICGISFNIGLALNNYSRVSLYVERSKVVEAIKARDYRILGERRPGARY
jgi:lipopolysaccharide export LptBFGC system permease protein LptF